MFGYFFGPRFASPDDVSTHDLKSEDTILRIRFGDLGLVKGEWPIVRTLEGWDRSGWPMPRFVRRDPLGKLQARIVEYSDTDPNQQVGEWLTDEDAQLEPDAVPGFGAVSVKLNSR